MRFYTRNASKLDVVERYLDNVLLTVLAVLMGVGAVLLARSCTVWAEEPSKPTLTETEELRLVNTYQAAVLAQVDFQAAQQRMARSRDAYTTIVEKLKADHKWPAATTFEINGETGHALVHLPPTITKPEVKP